jgi:long-chain acyl-CoA synthetase
MSWSIAETLRRQVGRDPSRVVLHYGDSTVTYGQMMRRSGQVAHALRAAGLGPGQVVAYLGRNTPEYFEVLFGAGLANVAMLPLNWRLARGELEYIVGDADVRVLVVAEEFAEAVTLPAGVQRVIFGDGPRSDYPAWVEAHPDGDPGVVVSDRDTSMLLYTSGTTGRPKGVILSNRALGLTIVNSARDCQLTEESATLVTTPVGHGSANLTSLIATWHGGRIVLHHDFDARATLRALAGEVTHATLVPTQLQMVMALPEARSGDYRRLHTLIYGASPITPALLRECLDVLGCRFVQHFGQTETAGAITQLDPTDHDPDGPRGHLLNSVGRPMPWVKLKVVDPETGQERPVGEAGEIWVHTEQRMTGYHNQPEETARTITADGWVRTGDGGYLDSAGYLFLADRIKDMIVTGGENVYPREVENVLIGHPGVAEVAVIGTPHPKWVETVTAVVVPVAGRDLDASGLVAYAREHLAHYKCPTSIRVVSELPRNAAGKVLKQVLRSTRADA